MRTFISLNPDQETKKRILEIQFRVKDIISEINKEFLNSIKWETEDKFHMTLFFIGEINETDINRVHFKLTEIENDLDNNEMIFLSKNISAFPKLSSPRVIIVELENKDKNVFLLSESINSKLKEMGFQTDKKFHPHITIGRVKRDRKINLTSIKDKNNFELEFSIKNFYLMKSELKSSGSEYSVLKQYGL